MRLKLLVIASLCLAMQQKQPVQLASTWMPCMPFCDTMCTGASAVLLTSNVASQYTALSSEVTSNTQSVGRLTNSFMDQQANIYSSETLNNMNRVRGYDGVAKTIAFTLEIINKIYERTIDHISQEIYQIKKNEKLGALAFANAKDNAVSHISSANSALKAAPSLASEIEAHKVRYKESNYFHSESSKTISNDKSGLQIPILINDIDFDIPNPFSLDEISSENWEEYQKLLTLLFNGDNLASKTKATDKQKWLKRQLALHVIGKSLSASIKIPDNRASTLLPLINEPSVTLKSALFERYKQEMTDVNMQTNTKASPTKSLLVIHNIQLSQKNLLLREIKETKQLKNALLALSKI